MCIIICDNKKIIYLNSGSKVKDLFLKHGGEGFKPSHLHLKLVCPSGL
jgi:hypothetical protein